MFLPALNIVSDEEWADSERQKQRGWAAFGYKSTFLNNWGLSESLKWMLWFRWAVLNNHSFGKCVLCGRDPLCLCVRTCWLICGLGQFVTFFPAWVFMKMPLIHVHSLRAYAKQTEVFCTYRMGWTSTDHRAHPSGSVNGGYTVMRLQQCQGHVFVCLLEMSAAALVKLWDMGLAAAEFHLEVLYFV